MNKYDPLRYFLERQSASSLTLNFHDVDRIVALPKSAKQYEWWWANEDLETTTHVQCIAWQRAGYNAFPNMQAAKVTFSKKEER